MVSANVLMGLTGGHSPGQERQREQEYSYGRPVGLRGTKEWRGPPAEQDPIWEDPIGVCGADITDWLKAKLKEIAAEMDDIGTHTIRIPVMGYEVTYRPYEAARKTAAAANRFRKEGIWDFKFRTNHFETPGCATWGINADCKETVRLCGICVSSHVAGNIAYGYIMSRIGYTQSEIHTIALTEHYTFHPELLYPRGTGILLQFQIRDLLKDWEEEKMDMASIDVGIKFNEGIPLCLAVTMLLARYARPECVRCNKKYKSKN